MSDRPSPPPEAQLIADALKRARVSVREAARRADMSEGRWRQIMNGYQTVSAGVHIPTTGPPETIARMAAVAGVTAGQLAEAGRPDAAAELRAVDQPAGPSEPHTARELREILEDDPELAEAVYNLVRTAQRARSGQPVEEEEPQRKDERRRGRGAG